MKKIYSVLVENRSGVLCKVAGLFSRRAFNIDSLVVGETDDPSVSCMTIVSSGDNHTLEQIEKQLNKKLDIIKVKTFDEPASISRELMLVKVKYNRNNRRDIMEICNILKAQIVDMSKYQMMIQICDVQERAVILKDAQFNQHRGSCPHRNCGAAEMPRSGKLNGEAVAGAVRTLHSVDSLAGFRYQATPRYNTDFA